VIPPAALLVVRARPCHHHRRGVGPGQGAPAGCWLRLRFAVANRSQSIGKPRIARREIPPPRTEGVI